MEGGGGEERGAGMMLEKKAECGSPTARGGGTHTVDVKAEVITRNSAVAKRKQV
jgi:hypothetical protein